jgi:hypothetical protein
MPAASAVTYLEVYWSTLLQSLLVDSASEQQQPCVWTRTDLRGDKNRKQKYKKDPVSL